MARDWTPTRTGDDDAAGRAHADQMYLGPGTASLGFADHNVNVNVRQPQAVSPPAGAATPMTDEEKGLVNQGAWAGASAAGAEAAGDWRNSAAQTLAKALAGYNAGAYRSQQVWRTGASARAARQHEGEPRAGATEDLCRDCTPTEHSSQRSPSCRMGLRSRLP